ncbi:MAG TPA: SelB C-terminal domain-containing protein, partial [Acidimicrobiales bacterium]|nr:SelB C-terminal domain-containing protein [Acidimicrobiales bacterium]
ALLVEQAGGALPADALEAEVGPLVGTVGGPLRVVGPDVVHEGLTERRRAELLDLVRRSGGAPEPHDPLGRIAADRLVADGAVERLAGLLRPGGSATEERRLATGRIADALDSAVPPLLTPEELRSTIGAAASHRSSAIRAGELVEVGPFLTTRASFEGLAAEVEAAIGDGATTVSAIRERIGLTRKYVLPLLETLDRRGLTARLGDERRWIAS